MLRIKGFDEDLKCQGMQFEVGKEYKTNRYVLELCTDTVFHYCKTLKQVNAFYNVTEDNRYCYIEVLGEEIEDDEKCGSNHIKIVREILGEELDILLGRVNGNTGNFNTGHRNTGHRNTGGWNTGDSNTGDFNAGDGNAGDGNTGYGNAGHFNTGHRNTGDCNTGNFNTGNFNTCNHSNGIFCTKEPKINIFNKRSKYTMREFMQTEYYRALHSTPFNLVKRRAVDFKTACAEWWEELSEYDKQLIREMPNFDAEIFEEITGIKEDK